MISTILFGCLLFTQALPLARVFAATKHNLKQAPEEVTTAEELMAAIESNKDIELVSDIDVSSINETLSANANIYTATLDGGFHRISGLAAPLVQKNEGQIRNLLITPKNNLWIPVNEAFGLITLHNAPGGIISAVGVEGDVSFLANPTATNNNLSLFAPRNDGSIDSCYYAGSLNIDGSDANLGFGTFAGTNTSTISHCFAVEDLSFESSGFGRVGKICGSLDGGTLSSCLATGSSVLTFKGQAGEFAHIVPDTKADAIQNCFFEDASISLQNLVALENPGVGKVETLCDYLEPCGYQSSTFGNLGFLKFEEDKLYRYLPDEWNLGVDNGGEYSGSVRIYLDNKEAKLNGKRYSSGTTTLSEAGNHRLEIKRDNTFFRRLDFTITSVVSGIEQNGSYRMSAAASFSGCNCFLDGKQYFSDTPIVEIGNHTLATVGVNGYRRSIDFVIEPEIQGVSDGASYDGSVIIRVERGDGAGFILNGEEQAANSSIVLNTPGEYEAIIKGANDYTKTCRFSIGIDVRAKDDVFQFSGVNEYVGSVRFLTSHTTVFIDGDPYRSGRDYQVVGNHTLTVFGTKGEHESFPFVIHPNVQGVADGLSCTRQMEFEVSSGDIFLDGNSIVAGKKHRVTMPGNHTLIIKGSNGYEKTIEFSVVLEAVLQETKQGFEYNFVFSGGNVTLDGMPFEGGTITQLGTHTIIVKGSQGEETYRRSFEIRGYLDSIPKGRYLYPPIIPVLDADCYLDGKLINCRNGYVRVEQSGLHELRIVGPGLNEVYTFEYANLAPQMSLVYIGAILILSAAVVGAILIRRRKS